MSSLLIVITALAACTLVHTFVPKFQKSPGFFRDSRKAVTPEEIYESQSLEEIFGRDGVLYFNNEPTEEFNPPFMFSPSKLSTIAEIPLIPFDDIIFPNSRDFLHVSDMRFRYVFQKVEEGDDIFGRCFLFNGKIGLVGSLCKILERRQEENGERQYIIEAVDRFRIRKILHTTPFLKAEVEIYPKDTFIPEDVPVSEQLCREIYYLLQVYIQLTRLQQKRSAEIVLTYDIYENRPKQSIQIENSNDSDYGSETDGAAASRHERFSNACANLLSTEKVILQQLLQTQSTRFRLLGVKSILVQAVGEIGALLSDEGLLTPDKLREIEFEAMSGKTEEIVKLEGIGEPLTLAAMKGSLDTLSNANTNTKNASSSSSTDSMDSDSVNIIPTDSSIDFDSVWDDTDKAFQ